MCDVRFKELLDRHPHSDENGINASVDVTYVFVHFQMFPPTISGYRCRLTQLWCWSLCETPPGNFIRGDESDVDNRAADTRANQGILWEDESPDASA